MWLIGGLSTYVCKLCIRTTIARPNVLGVAFGLSSPSSTTVTQAHGLTGFQPNASDNQETKFAVGAESFPESKGAMNSCAGFQPSVDTGFQPKEHSLFEPAAPKERKYEPTAVKSIPRGVAGRPEKLPSVSEAFAHLFVGDKVTDIASSATTRCSPEANDAKNSGAGFQPSVDSGFQPKEHSLVEQASRSKEMARLAEQRHLATPSHIEMQRLAYQRRRAKPEYKERQRLYDQRRRATPEYKERKLLDDQRRIATAEAKERKRLERIHKKHR